MSRYLWDVRKGAWLVPGGLLVLAVILIMFGRGHRSVEWFLQPLTAVWLLGVLGMAFPALRVTSDGALVVTPRPRVTELALLLVVTAAESAWRDPQFDSAIIAAALVLILALTVASRPLQLTRDGVHDRSMIGSVFVPWSALSLEQPGVDSDDRVPLRLAAPAAAVRTGRTANFFNLYQLPRTQMTAERLARVIDRYAGHPEYRLEIGTPEGLDNLRAMFRSVVAVDERATT